MGVGIDVITNRLPFDQILGADAHNREMSILSDALALFGAMCPPSNSSRPASYGCREGRSWRVSNCCNRRYGTSRDGIYN